MKQLFLLLILFSTLLISCGSDTPDPTPTQSYTNGSVIAFEYPATWHIIERPDNVVITNIERIKTAGNVTNLHGELEGTIIYFNYLQADEIERDMPFIRTDETFEADILQRFSEAMQFTTFNAESFVTEDDQSGVLVQENKLLKIVTPGVDGEGVVTLASVYDENQADDVVLMVAFNDGTPSDQEVVEQILASVFFE